MELSSVGIKLAYSAAESGTFKTLYGLRSTPEMGGEPEKIDITNLNDKNRRHITGVRDLGDLEFNFFYNSDDEGTSQDDVDNSFKVLRAFDVAGTDLWFKLTYPDKTGYMWRGRPTVKRSGAEVNAALAFTLKTSVLTELTDIT